ncbi:MAG: hypothetical protein VKL59_09860 [Nostocaceae cyanobacterium]|nr:hypothetical protein [Nostocaceae cyanobacterium]
MIQMALVGVRHCLTPTWILMYPEFGEMVLPLPTQAGGYISRGAR